MDNVSYEELGSISEKLIAYRRQAAGNDEVFVAGSCYDCDCCFMDKLDRYYGNGVGTSYRGCCCPCIDCLGCNEKCECCKC